MSSINLVFIYQTDQPALEQQETAPKEEETIPVLEERPGIAGPDEGSPTELSVGILGPALLETKSSDEDDNKEIEFSLAMLGPSLLTQPPKVTFT